jgi:protein involved in polysaccharide export with SLBB domain
MNFNRLSYRFYTNIISWDGRRAASLAALALAAAAVCAPSINAQQRRGDTQPEQPAIQSSASEMGNAKILNAAEKDYRISAGDVIQIQVEDAPELSHNYRVSSSGHIEMPVLGMVEAQKRTTFELARQIRKGLQDEEYLNTPSVLVTIKQYNSQTFRSRVRFAVPESIRPKGDHRC